MAALSLLLFAVICLALMAGYPVAFTLAGVSLLFAGVSSVAGVFDASFLTIIPNRIYGIFTNQNLLAVRVIERTPTRLVPVTEPLEERR